MGLMLSATMAGAEEAGILLGTWCATGDETIWIGHEDAVLGEHAYCRWDTPMSDGLSHLGLLHCRTTEGLHDAKVEHPLTVALTMDARGVMTISYPEGGAPEEWRRCDRP